MPDNYTNPIQETSPADVPENTPLPTDGYVNRLSNVLDSIKPVQSNAATSRAGAPDFSSVWNIINSGANRKPTMNALTQDKTFDWRKSGADMYVGSENFNTLGFDPDRDNESMYGYAMTTGQFLSRAFGGGWQLAKNTFVDTWKDYGNIWNGIMNLPNVHSVKDVVKGFDDSPEEMLEKDKRTKDIMSKYHIFERPEDQNSIVNRAFFGNMVQQSGFALGMMGQIMSEQLLTKAVELGLSATVVGLGGAAVVEGVEGAATGLKIGRIGRIMEELRSYTRNAKTMEKYTEGLHAVGDTLATPKLSSKIWDAVKDGVNANIPVWNTVNDISKAKKAGLGTSGMVRAGLGSFKRGLSEFNLAHSEALMEGASTYSDMYNKLVDNYTDKNGYAPSGKDLEDIVNMSGRAARANVASNDIVLLLSNRLVLGSFFKSFKAASAIGRELNLAEEMAEKGLFKVAGKAGDKELEQVYRKGVLGKLSSFPKIAATFGKNTVLKEAGKSLLQGIGQFEISEGLQELTQNATNKFWSDYYTDAYSLPKMKASVGDALQNRSLLKAYDNPYEKEGAQTFLMGALTGLLFGPFAHIGSHLVNNTNKGYKEHVEKLDKDILAVNDFYKDPSSVLSETVRKFNTLSDFSGHLQEAVKNRDQFEFENIKNDMLVEMVRSAKRTNSSQALVNTLRNWSKQFTKEEFEKAFIGFDYESSKDSVSQFVDKMADTMQDYLDVRERLDESVPDISFNGLKEGSSSYDDALFRKKSREDALDMLAGNKIKAQLVLGRLENIYQKVSSNKAMGNALSDAFRVLVDKEATLDEISSLQFEIDALSQADKTDRMPQQLLKHKKAQLDILTKWNTSVFEHEKGVNQDGRSQNWADSKRLFLSYLDSVNEQKNSNPKKIAQDDLNGFLGNFRDYFNLNQKYKNHIEAVDWLLNDKNRGLFEKRAARGRKYANHKLIADRYLDTLGPGFRFENQELLNKYDELAQKHNNDPLSAAEDQDMNLLLASIMEKTRSWNYSTEKQEYDKDLKSVIQDAVFNNSKEYIVRYNQLRELIDNDEATEDQFDEYQALQSKVQDDLHAEIRRRRAEPKEEPEAQVPEKEEEKPVAPSSSYNKAKERIEELGEKAGDKDDLKTLKDILKELDSPDSVLSTALSDPDITADERDTLLSERNLLRNQIERAIAAINPSERISKDSCISIGDNFYKVVSTGDSIVLSGINTGDLTLSKDSFNRNNVVIYASEEDMNKALENNKPNSQKKEYDRKYKQVLKIKPNGLDEQQLLAAKEELDSVKAEINSPQYGDRMNPAQKGQVLNEIERKLSEIYGLLNPKPDNSNKDEESKVLPVDITSPDQLLRLDSEEAKKQPYILTMRTGQRLKLAYSPTNKQWELGFADLKNPDGTPYEKPSYTDKLLDYILNYKNQDSNQEYLDGLKLHVKNFDSIEDEPLNDDLAIDNLEVAEQQAIKDAADEWGSDKVVYPLTTSLLETKNIHTEEPTDDPSIKRFYNVVKTLRAYKQPFNQINEEYKDNNEKFTGIYLAIVPAGFVNKNHKEALSKNTQAFIESNPDKINQGIYGVLSKSNGEFLKFDGNNSLSHDGQIVVVPIRTPSKVMLLEKGENRTDYSDIQQSRDMEQLKSLREALPNNPDKVFVANISDASKGKSSLKREQFPKLNSFSNKEGDFTWGWESGKKTLTATKTGEFVDEPVFRPELSTLPHIVDNIAQALSNWEAFVNLDKIETRDENGNVIKTDRQDSNGIGSMIAYLKWFVNLNMTKEITVDNSKEKAKYFIDRRKGFKEGSKEKNNIGNFTRLMLLVKGEGKNRYVEIVPFDKNGFLPKGNKWDTISEKKDTITGDILIQRYEIPVGYNPKEAADLAYIEQLLSQQKLNIDKAVDGQRKEKGNKDGKAIENDSNKKDSTNPWDKFALASIENGKAVRKERTGGYTQFLLDNGITVNPGRNSYLRFVVSGDMQNNPNVSNSVQNNIPTLHGSTEEQKVDIERRRQEELDTVEQKGKEFYNSPNNVYNDDIGYQTTQYKKQLVKEINDKYDYQLAALEQPSTVSIPSEKEISNLDTGELTEKDIKDTGCVPRM